MTDGIESNATVVVVRRFFAVPRERVFAAWLDPVALARFMRPRADATATAQVDARAGKFLIVMRHSGKAVEHSGSYLEIDRQSGFHLPGTQSTLIRWIRL
jgi:uncharacterized protein YndB with AHSA1/START domain